MLSVILSGAPSVATLLPAGNETEGRADWTGHAPCTQRIRSWKGHHRGNTRRTHRPHRTPAQPADPRDQPVLAPARLQSGRLVLLGHGSPGAGQAGGQADPALDRV